MNEKPSPGIGGIKPKLIAAGSLALLLCSVGVQIHSTQQRAELEAQVAQERNNGSQLKAELERDARSRSELADKYAKSQALAADQEDQRVAAEQRAFALEQRVQEGQGARANADKWRKEAERNASERDRVQKELADARSSIKDLGAENTALGQRAASLQSEMDRLALDRAAVDKSLTQAFRGKREKLTVLAKKTRKLQLSMVLPASMAKDARYVITTPDGKTITSEDPAVHVSTSSQPGAALASGGKGATPGADQVKLEYLPKQRLKAGIYKIEVKAGERALGSTFIALR